jgi:hypothetical protein
VLSEDITDLKRTVGAESDRPRFLGARREDSEAEAETLRFPKPAEAMEQRIQLPALVVVAEEQELE